MTPRTKTIGLIAAVLLPALPLSAQTTPTNAAVLRVARVWGFPGRTVDVPVVLAHTGGVSGVQLDLSYAADKLVAGAFQANGLSNNVVLRSRLMGPGQDPLLAYTKEVTPLGTNQPLGTLPFSVPPREVTGGGPVALQNVVVARTNGTDVTPIHLIPGAVVVAPVFIGEDGLVDLYLRVLSNRTYVVQATTDFTNWVNVATNFALTEYLFASDATASGLPMRFYRAMSVDGQPPQFIALLPVQGDGRLAFSYPSTPGRTYVLQASTNLATWADVGASVAASNLLIYTNLVRPTIPQEFFRVLEQR